eukprot:COSAG02_NODE_1873_length_10578_cov_50.375418_4_plen_199_part_01
MFLNVGIGVFCSRGIGVSWVAASRHRGLPSSGRHCFFLGEKSGAAQKKRENAHVQTRWTSKRVLVGDFMRECRRVAGAAVRRIQADQPPSIRRVSARAAARTRAPRPAGAARNVTTPPDARSGEVRQSSDAPSVRRRWQHGSDDGAVDSTSITGYCIYTDDGPSNSSTPGQEEETTCRAAILQVAELRQQNDPEAPGNG